MFFIRAFKIKMETNNGEYGFFTEFKDHLNIIRGNNTSGKSTLLNAIIYSLGMEELMGGRNESVLPYALKSKLLDQEKNTEYAVITSYVLIELQNSKKEVVTLRRAITAESRDPKLIEIISGPFLTKPQDGYSIIPTFLHDAGSAQLKDSGFFAYLEQYLGFSLPFVPNNQGGETKLYIQTIFASLIVEQKTGWTDYIANIPYFRIRNAEQKVFEFLLSFDVFNNELKKNELVNEFEKIKDNWHDSLRNILTRAKQNNIRVNNIPDQPSEEYENVLVGCDKNTEEGRVDLSLYLSSIVERSNEINIIEKKTFSQVITEADNANFEKAVNDLNIYSLRLREIINEISLLKESSSEMQKSSEQIYNDIQKNKSVLKIKKLGYEQDIKVAQDICPTCQQHLKDSLVQVDDQYIMSIEENIAYLESQYKMILRHSNAKKESIDELERQKISIQNTIQLLEENIRSIQKGITSMGFGNIEADLRTKISLENEIKDIQQFLDLLEDEKDKLSYLRDQYKRNRENYANLPKEYLSIQDKNKLGYFMKMFLNNVTLFEYSSTALSSIILDEEKYIPCMIGESISRDIRTEIISKQFDKTKLKSDSSASDFVRLIWAYLLAIYQTSNRMKGNHPGFIIFDEPAQHSMAVTSLHNLLQLLNHDESLQSIVGCSFDESDEVFLKATKDINFNRIDIGEKLIKKIG